jgi:outer membrane biosynthesis protein TonB
MKKCSILLMALVATSAWAQQNIDITAEQFNSGAANSQLTALGRQAAASGKRLVVTAPQHWHAQIAARIRAGGKADVVLKDGFYETLLVRVEDEAPEPAKPEPKPAPVAVAPKPAPAPVRTQPEPRKVEVAPAPPAQPMVETPPPAPAPAPAPVVQTPPPAAAPAPAAVEEPMASAEPAAPEVVDPKAPIMLVTTEPGDADPVREAMEKRYNEGKRIAERVDPANLRVGDVIYAGKAAAVVVRRERSRILRMWLIGSLNVNQLGISNEGVNKYKVLNGTIE